MRFDVIAMGSATQDVFARSDADLVTFAHNGSTESLLAYPLGSKILITDLDFQVGGGGTNAATTFARQGLRTGYVGKLGKDTPGLAVFKFLKEEGIAFLGAVGGQTGYSVVLDSEQEDRTILTFKGANNQLGTGELHEQLACRWLYCSSMLGESYATMRTLMKRLKQTGTRIAFNPSEYQVKGGAKALADVLPLLDVLILNKQEAGLLLQQHDETPQLLAGLRTITGGIVVVTDGAQGTSLDDGTRSIHAGPAKDLEIVETTGAGDAFGSGFVAGLARGMTTELALRLGMRNAESVISAYGAKTRILTRDEGDRLLKHDQRRISSQKTHTKDARVNA